MESLDNTTKTASGFFKHVLNFDEDSKSDMLNVIQYSIISIIPIVILNKTMQKYVPEADEQKGSIEILAEIIIQIICIFIGLLLIHRVITYIPTYSGMKYPEFSIIFIILAVLMITMSLQTKLGDKISIITDRLYELWEGKKDNNQKSNKPVVKVSQPISQEKQINYNDGTSINQLPSNSSYSQNNQQNNSEPVKMPNYNNMYKQDQTPLINASSPIDENYSNGDNILAASDALGGSFSSFSSW
jgi:hypothetical protein|uniref:Transmembrane protein n=1 Tax=viral metagenome TaxID=1070528 RepID=A0A6C0IGM3_9ZZZZ